MPTPIVDVPTGLIYQTKDLDHGAALSAVAAAYEGSGILSQLISLSATPGWLDLQAKRMQALDATLTGCVPVPLPALMPWDTLPTGAAAGTRDGGSIVITDGTGGGASEWVYLTRQLLSNAKTSHWAIAWRGSFNAPEAADTYRLGFFGLGGEDTGSAGVFAEEYYSYGDHTNMVLVASLGGASVTSTVSSVAVDANVMHDWLISFDTTTLRLQRDGATIASTTTLTNVPTTGVWHIAGRGNLGHYVEVSDIAFGYVRP